MSENKDKIIALLSTDDTLASRASVRTLQSALKDEGFTQNSDRYPNPDGIFGRLTRADLLGFIEKNPEALLSVSPVLVQKLMDAGMKERLQEVVNANPHIREQLAAQARDMLGDKNIDALHNTAELKTLQTKLALLGVYEGRIDGFTGPKSRKAVETLSDKFTAVAVEQPPPEDTLKITVSPDSPGETAEAGSEETPEDETATPPEVPQTAIDLYLQALNFTDRGLKPGDGGERNWDNKLDGEVWSLQVLLNRTGADIQVDGNYGGQTANAVKAFQKDQGLPETGIADIATLRALVAHPDAQPDFQAKADARDYTVPEYYKIMSDILPKVQEDTGVSAGYLMAVWGKETRFGEDMKSGTGSQGPFQFTGSTFALMINRHGDEIAQHLKEIGQDELAQRVLESQAGRVDKTLRYDPYVSTYAAAYLTRANGIDTTNENNWGRAYAAHNIGLGGLSTVLRNRNTAGVGTVVDRNNPGSPAAHNPFFFRGNASGEKVLQRYQRAMKTWNESFEQEVAPRLAALENIGTESDVSPEAVQPGPVIRMAWVDRIF